ALRIGTLAAGKYGKPLRVTLFDFAAGTQETFRVNGRQLARSAPPLSLGPLRWVNYRVIDKKTRLLRPLSVFAQGAPKTSKDDVDPPPIRYFPGVHNLAPGPGQDISVNEYSDEWKKRFERRPSKLSETSISIIHVYDFIQTLGAKRKPDDAGIQELHFFC